MSFSGTKGYITKPKQGVMLNPLHPLSRGLIGQWILNEGSGSIVHDMSQYSHDLTLKNMGINTLRSGWCGSKFGGGLAFDGSDDYLSHANVATLQPQDFTIEFWYNPHSGGPALCTDNYYGNDGFGIYCLSGSSINLWTGDNSTKHYFGLTSVDRVANAQHHLIVTKIGTAVKSYWNGMLDKSGSLGSSTINYTASYNFAVGRGIRSSATDYTIDATVDMVRLYNRGIATSEVKQLYSNPFCNMLPVPIRRYYVAAAPSGVIMNQFQNYNIGADLYNGGLIA